MLDTGTNAKQAECKTSFKLRVWQRTGLSPGTPKRVIAKKTYIYIIYIYVSGPFQSLPDVRRESIKRNREKKGKKSARYEGNEKRGR